MTAYKVSVVAYHNSIPFHYGIEKSGLANEIQLSVDTPSDCSKKLLEGSVDIGLIPVASIPQLTEHYIIAPYCISANGNVRTVCLHAECPVEQLEKVYLDYQSRSSVALVQILFKKHWRKKVEFLPTAPGYEGSVVKENSGAIIIGDRNFIYENRYKYCYDLSKAWQELHDLPFVFACWTANKPIEKSFINKFNAALQLGTDNIPEAIAFHQLNTIPQSDIEHYLNHNIEFLLNDRKIEAMQLFLEEYAALTNNKIQAPALNIV